MSLSDDTARFPTTMPLGPGNQCPDGAISLGDKKKSRKEDSADQETAHVIVPLCLLILASAWCTFRCSTALCSLLQPQSPLTSRTRRSFFGCWSDRLFTDLCEPRPNSAHPWCSLPGPVPSMGCGPSTPGAAPGVRPFSVPRRSTCSGRLKGAVKRCLAPQRKTSFSRVMPHA